MSINAKIASDVQESSLGKLVTMFKIDCTDLGGSTYRFVPATISGSTVYFNSIEYLPIDIEATGFEYTSKGQLPKPEITLANASRTMASAIIEYDDLLGAVVTRRRTFEKYLDGQAEADPTAKFPDDIYVIERKALHSKNLIKWELSAYMDFEGKYLPNRQILRDTCIWRYRIWDSDEEAFNYDNVECPYTGSSMFKRDGTVTTVSGEDICGKRLSDCASRYVNDPLPFGGFPGVGKIRV
jgi:lambda family phage minor tail protein L